MFQGEWRGREGGGGRRGGMEKKGNFFKIEKLKGKKHGKKRENAEWNPSLSSAIAGVTVPSTSFLHERDESA